MVFRPYSQQRLNCTRCATVLLLLLMMMMMMMTIEHCAIAYDIIGLIVTPDSFYPRTSFLLDFYGSCKGKYNDDLLSLQEMH